MAWQYGFYSVSLVFAALICAVLTASIWSRRPTPGSVPLSILMFGMTLWSAMQAASVVSSPDIATMIRCEKVMYLGIVTVPGACYAFVVSYADILGERVRRLWPLLLIVPAATMALVATNERHGLIWSSVQLVGSERLGGIAVVHGPAFWVYTVYSYLLLFISLGILVSFLLHARPVYRRQLVLVIAGCVVPWVGNALYLVGLQPVAALDLTPISFAVTAIVLAQGLHRWRFLDLRPVARDAVIEQMGDVVLILDDVGRIVDHNPVGEAFLTATGQARGCYIEDVWPGSGHILDADADAKQVHRVRLGPGAGETKDFELDVLWTPGSAASASPRVLLAHDVTERERRRSEREHMVQELQGALASADDLRGLLPICASCKRIRSDEGYWIDVERFLADHSRVILDRALCPDCRAKLAQATAEGAKPEADDDIQED